MRRTLLTAITLSALALGTGTGLTSPASAAKEKVDAEVTLYSMVELPGDESGPYWDDPRTQEALEANAKLKPKKVRIDGTLDENEQEQVLTEAAEAAMTQWEAELSQASGASDIPGDVGTQAYDQVSGNCGWSSIRLDDAFGTYYAYVKARFSIIRPGFAYRTNIHVWDTAWNDFSEWNFPETGNLNGATSWWDDFTFRVDESGAKYGATLNRADVYTSNGTWCHSGNPTVDNVQIF